MASRFVVEAPASSANLGCGYDVFALALGRPKDTLTVARGDSGISLTVRGMEPDSEPRKNAVSVVARAILEEYGLEDEGVAMSLTKGVPVGAGLGSSGASSVAAAVGIDQFFGLGLSPSELVRFAGLGEKAASGSAHYDNVAASLAGGFVVLRREHDFVKMSAPGSMAVCLVTPQVKLPHEKTKFARSLLPRTVPMPRAAAVSGAAAAMVHGFAVGSVEEIGEAMAQSLVDGPRSQMIPRFAEVRRAALSQGASGVCISGAGPTVLAVCRSQAGRSVLSAMVKTFREGGVQSSGLVTRAGRGCTVREARVPWLEGSSGNGVRRPSARPREDSV